MNDPKKSEALERARKLNSISAIDRQINELRIQIDHLHQEQAKLFAWIHASNERTK